MHTMIYTNRPGNFVYVKYAIGKLQDIVNILNYHNINDRKRFLQVRREVWKICFGMNASINGKLTKKVLIHAN